MSQQEDAWERLDAEFDHYLVDMKPFVLKLPQKQERQRCALWIKKLCDPAGAGTGITGRKNRNLYAKLLLHMLRRGVLEGPFTQRPDEGMLKTLPTYMTYSRRLSSRSLSPTQRSDEETPASHDTEDRLKKAQSSLDDSDLEARLNSWNLGIENPRYLREKPIPRSLISPKVSLARSVGFREEQALFRLHEKEADMKIKAMEAKFHEEKLKLQQKHDADVQKILDRKNSETEELKALYRSKQSESEETIRQLEKKVQTLLRESQVIRESKETQITELKKLCEQSADSLKNEWEKKLHDAVADMEQEKFQLQKKHTENIQELLDDTNARLLKMESDYVAQTKATTQTVKELESRVQQLTVEAESSNVQRQRLSQEKSELEKSYQAVMSDLHEMKARCNALQKERDRVTQDYEKRIQQLQAKYDSDISFMSQQNALSAAKASDLIEELERRVSQLKQQLQESEHERLQQLRDQESGFQKEKLNLERVCDRKVHDLQQQLEHEREKAEKKISRVESMLKEKEEQLLRVTETQRIQAQQADAALEEFKRQVETNSEKVYSEMKQQMEKVEADLSRSKFLREKQSKEFSRQLEDLKQRYEQQIVELKLLHEQEKTHLFQQHNTEKDGIIKDHEKEIDRLEKQLRNTITEHEMKSQAWRQRDAQTISDLEAQVHRLKEELIQTNSQRKQQLVELALLRDEEKQKTAQEHQVAMSKLRTEMESVRLSLQRSHAEQSAEALEKASGRLKQIEKEHAEKLAKTTQVVSELQASIASMRDEHSRQQLSMERRLQEAAARHEDEKRQMMKDNKVAIKILKDEVENYCTQLRTAEKKLQEKELTLQEQVTNIRQEYELRIRDLMPSSIRQELEDTITSLKSQVNFLQKRSQVLQEDLNNYHSQRL